jgi:hypothetical protein
MHCMTDKPMEESPEIEAASSLELTAEEAHRILSMCLMSPAEMDEASESAMRKLAAYCREHDRNSSGQAESGWELWSVG